MLWAGKSPSGFFDCVTHDDAVSHFAQDDGRLGQAERTSNGNDNSQYGDSGCARMTTMGDAQGRWEMRKNDGVKRAR